MTTESNPRRILAIDAATLTGWAHSSGRHGEWRLGKGDERASRLRRMILGAGRLYGVDLIVYELASYGAGFRVDKRTGRKFQQMASIKLHNELAGAIKDAAIELGAELWGYHPSTIKAQTTGSGRASKEQMIAAVNSLYGVETDSDNVADAVAMLEMAKRGVLPSSERKKRERAAIKAAEKRQRTLFAVQGRSKA